MPQLTKAQAARRVAGARARAMGDLLEKATFLELTKGGVLAYRVATPTVMRRGRRCFTDKVAGDFFGITPTGAGVLVECKHRTGTDGEPRRPRPSDFEPHQIQALRAWHRRGGLALIAWWGEGRKVEIVPAVRIVGEG